jgi:hypothetical protein
VARIAKSSIEAKEGKVKPFSLLFPLTFSFLSLSACPLMQIPNNHSFLFSGSNLKRPKHVVD